MKAKWFGWNVSTQIFFTFQCIIRELKQRQSRWREQQKCNKFRIAKQQLCTFVTLFCTFLCRRYATTTWKCLISRWAEDGNTRQSLSLSQFSLILIQSPESLSIQPYQKFANIWRIERVGISAIKFKVARIHFLSDVFAAVAVLIIIKSETKYIRMWYSSCHERETKKTP